MGTRERPIDRARRLTAEQLRALGRELHLARIGAGLSLRDVAAAAHVSHTEVWRIERACSPTVRVATLGRVAGIVGLALSVRVFLDGDPIRDAAHVRLLTRLHARIHPDLRWRTEVPLPLPGDRRAWDATIGGRGFVVGVEAETRIRDAQAVVRRLNLKQRDGELDRVVLLVAGTRANRQAVRLAMDDVASFTIASRDALLALREARDPGGNAVIIL